MAKADRRLNAGRADEALGLYSRLAERLSAAATVGQSKNSDELVGQALLGLGHAHWALADARNAVKQYRRSWRKKCLDQTGLTRLAQWQFAQGDYKAVCNLLRSDSSREGQLRILFARSLVKTGSPQTALAEYEIAAKELPGSWEPLYYAGCALGHLGRHQEAKHRFTAAIGLDASSGRAYLMRGHAHLKSGVPQSAWQDYLSAERFGLSAPGKAYGSVGVMLSRLEKHREAYTALGRAISLGERDESLLAQFGWYALTVSSLPGKEVAAAGESLRALMRSDRGASTTRFLLARLLADQAQTRPKALPWADTAEALGRMFALTPKWGASFGKEGHTARALAGVLRSAGRCELAIDLLEAAQGCGAHDSATAHALLVLSHRQAVDSNAAKRANLPAWQRTVRNATMLLADDAFWPTWVRTQAQHYRTTIEKVSISRTRQRLEQYLSDQHPATSNWGGTLRVELAAARALGRAGGFPAQLPANGTLVCGPDMIRHFGLTTDFGRFVAAQYGPGLPRQAVVNLPDLLRGSDFRRWFGAEGGEDRTLRRYFSTLATAQMLFDSERPEEALKAIEKTRCPRCAKRPRPGKRRREGLPQVCAADCQSFAEINAAYSASASGVGLLQEDAAHLAYDLHIALGDRSFRPENGGDLARILKHWKDAIEVTEKARLGEERQSDLVRRALGMSAELNRQKNLDGAVLLLEGAYELCRGTYEESIAGRLAQVLNARGVAAANGPEHDWAAAASDFRRSVDLNPHSWQRRRNLAVALQARAAQLLGRGARKAGNLVLEARGILEEARLEFPQDQAPIDEIERVAEVSLAVALRLNAAGVRKAERGRSEDALRDLRLAYELAPRERIIRENIRIVQQAGGGRAGWR